MCARIRDRPTCLTFAFMAMVLAGCGGGDSKAPPPNVEVTAPPSPRAPRSTADAPATVIADTGNSDATLRQLNQALRDYVIRTRTVPKNFEEFAAKAQVSFPAAPSGKKYAIHGQEVTLVKQ